MTYIGIIVGNNNNFGNPYKTKGRKISVMILVKCWTLVFVTTTN